jgi:hypothetical protein
MAGLDDNSDVVLLTPGLFAIQALEGLQAVGEEQDILKEIRRGIHGDEKDEPVARVVLELKATGNRHVQSAEWSLLDGLLYFMGKIYIPNSFD